MKVRYVVEGKFSSSFTASKKVKDEGEAIRLVMILGLNNLSEGYAKYSNPILYDDNNTIIKRMEIKSVSNPTP